MRILMLVILVAVCSCNDHATNHGQGGDTIAKTLNKSDIINDSSRLPNDSTNTGVQH